jgi:hypothetical protein
MVVDYIEDRCSKEAIETNGVLLLSPIVLKEARMFGRVADEIEVAPGIFQSKEDFEANMAFDEERDNKLSNGN